MIKQAGNVSQLPSTNPAPSRFQLKALCWLEMGTELDTTFLLPTGSNSMPAMDSSGTKLTILLSAKAKGSRSTTESRTRTVKIEDFDNSPLMPRADMRAGINGQIAALGVTADVKWSAHFADGKLKVAAGRHLGGDLLQVEPAEVFLPAHQGIVRPPEATTFSRRAGGKRERDRRKLPSNHRIRIFGKPGDLYILKTGAGGKFPREGAPDALQTGEWLR